MNIEAIQTLLSKNFPGGDIELSSEGNHLHLIIISEIFEGMAAVKKQQAVYNVLNEFIASGEVHAVHMQTLTPQEAN